MLPGLPIISEIIPDPPHEVYMRRCLQLAAMGAGYTAPNPMVGAVLVHEGRIIGEGYHQMFGKAHAEVNCIHSVAETDRPLISSSTLYVSLEPCAHHGKTPPCADLIIQEKIPRVAVACRDPFPEVDGRGMEKLMANKVNIIFPVMEKEAIELNRRFFTFHQKRRPYIILKWAESVNHKMAGSAGERLLISNDYSNREVHRWRSEEAAILIGTKTALLDNPELTTRLWNGKNPIRLILDRYLKLPETLKVFDHAVPTVLLNILKDGQHENLLYKKIDADSPLVNTLLSALYSLNILSVLVEGGAGLLKSFLDSGVWDEARIITNDNLQIPEGLDAPELTDAWLSGSETCLSDSIRFYRNKNNFRTMI